MATIEELETKLAGMEQRLQAMEAIEAIKQTKFDYFHCIDLKRWDQLGNCFAKDIEASYGRDGWQVSGRENLVEWLRGAEGGDNYSVSHASHNEQITLISDTEAEGFFKLHDWVRIDPSITLRGWGHYTDHFVKEADGQWRIKVLSLSYEYKEEHSVYRGNDGPSMLGTDPLELNN